MNRRKLLGLAGLATASCALGKEYNESPTLLTGSQWYHDPAFNARLTETVCRLGGFFLRHQSNLIVGGKTLPMQQDKWGNSITSGVSELLDLRKYYAVDSDAILQDMCIVECKLHLQKLRDDLGHNLAIRHIECEHVAYADARDMVISVSYFVLPDTTWDQPSPTCPTFADELPLWTIP